MGWRFLTVPQRTFDTRPDIALLTLNPGGSGIDPSQGEASCEYGCAYRLESWGAPAGKSALQVQIQALLDQLRRRLAPNTTPVDFMDQSVLGAYYLPFRSPDLSSLANRGKSLDFAKSLWTQILAPWTPRLIITIDHYAFAGIQSILAGKPTMQRQFVRAFPTGWGNCRADVARYESTSTGPSTVLRLPHLSTYKLFSRGQCQVHLGEILDCAVAHSV